jgi:hypothetical protein
MFLQKSLLFIENIFEDKKQYKRGNTKYEEQYCIHIMLDLSPNKQLFLEVKLLFYLG